jgi:hypothetical protein
MIFAFNSYIYFWPRCGGSALCCEGLVRRRPELEGVIVEA